MYLLISTPDQNTFVNKLSSEEAQAFNHDNLTCFASPRKTCWDEKLLRVPSLSFEASLYVAFVISIYF